MYTCVIYFCSFSVNLSVNRLPPLRNFKDNFFSKKKLQMMVMNKSTYASCYVALNCIKSPLFLILISHCAGAKKYAKQCMVL